MMLTPRGPQNLKSLSDGLMVVMVQVFPFLVERQRNGSRRDYA